MSGLRSGEVAAAARVNPQTLRYYERRGLLARPDRSLGGHRRYPARTVTVLRAIKTAQGLGFTLDEVAELLGRDASLRGRAAAKLVEVEAHIGRLHETAATLRAAVDAGCDDLTTCADHPDCPLTPA